MQNLTLVAGLHGNEALPLEALRALNLSVIPGHPQALLEGRRFIEEDLNRCFGRDGSTLEHHRAKYLSEEILPKRPVLDFHTFSCDSEPFAIVVDEQYLPLAKSLGLPHVVIMKFDIKQGGSLIGMRGGVSVEMGQHYDYASYLRTQEVVRRLEQPCISPDVRVYEVIDILREPGDYVNFQEHPSQFTPVLAGETAYEHFGLKARRVE